MKKLLLEYASIIGYIIIGLVFSLSSFLLILNFYHYNEVNHCYEKNNDDLEFSSKIKKQLTLIENNIELFDNNSYNSTEDIYNMQDIGSKINSCVVSINNSDLFEILDKNKASISDVYELHKIYENVVVNDCLIKQLYDLALLADKNYISNSSLVSIAPFLKNNILQLKDENIYVKKILKNNSSYYFNSNLSKISIFDMTRDSYYEVISSYRNSIDFIEEISIWYKNTIIGG